LGSLNIVSFVLEVPIACIQGSSDVIGAWTTVRKLDHRDDKHVATLQVSRLGNPLVNELFIGLKDKNLFSEGEPADDGRFVDYVTHPTLPSIIDILFRDALGATSDIAPSNIPRDDLVAAFLTGIPTINQPPGVVGSEMMRLNVTIAATPAGSQNQFGVIGGDAAGFPNGRRPGDDVVDIALRVGMGRLCHIPLGYCVATDAPVGDVDLTDGSPQSDADFDAVFPYLRTPNPGSTTDPDPTSCVVPPQCPDPCSACPNPCLACGVTTTTTTGGGQTTTTGGQTTVTATTGTTGTTNPCASSASSVLASVVLLLTLLGVLVM